MHPGQLPDFPMLGADVAAVAAMLRDVQLDRATDVDVVNAIAGWQQVVDAATAAQAAAISELVARRPVTRDGVADEVALALSCTRRRATHLIGRAAGLDEFAVLRDALASGMLDAAKVDLLLDEVAVLPVPAADAVLRDVLERADGLTTTQLRRLVRRHVLATRPEVAAARATKARRERCVSLQHGPDGMAWVHAYLPAPDAVAVHGVIDALACAQRARDDDRSADQRRADALSGLFAGILATGALPDGTPLPTPQGHRVGVQVAVGATTLLGLDDLPGELIGYGPIPAAMARDLARDGTWRRVLTDAAGHVLHVDEHTHPAGLVMTPAGAQSRWGWSSTAPSGATPARRDGPGGRGTSREGRSGEQRPGEQRSREQRTRETAPGGPPSGGAGRAGYRPGASLRRYVLVRDQVCAFAGCSMPAWRCDLDHALPFDTTDADAGPTCACNLRPLCRRHHRLKTHLGWSVSHDPETGITATTSPTGFTYLRPSPTLLMTTAQPPGRGTRRRQTPPDGRGGTPPLDGNGNGNGNGNGDPPPF